MKCGKRTSFISRSNKMCKLWKSERAKLPIQLHAIRLTSCRSRDVQSSYNPRRVFLSMVIDSPSQSNYSWPLPLREALGPTLWSAVSPYCLVSCDCLQLLRVLLTQQRVGVYLQLSIPVRYNISTSCIRHLNVNTMVNTWLISVYYINTPHIFAYAPQVWAFSMQVYVHVQLHSKECLAF